MKIFNWTNTTMRVNSRHACKMLMCVEILINCVPKGPVLSIRYVQIVLDEPL